MTGQEIEKDIGGTVFVIGRMVGRVLRSDRQQKVTTIHTPAHDTPDGGSRPASSVTRTTQHDTMQLQLADGSPHTLKIQNADFLVREGDVLHLIWVAKKGKEKVLCGLFNRATGQEDWLDGNMTRLFFLTEPMIMGILLSFVIGVVGMVGGMMLLGPFLGTPMILLPVILPVLTLRADRRGRAAIKALKTHAAQDYAAHRGHAFP